MEKKITYSNGKGNNMNKVILIGRMTKDAQLAYTSNTQKAVARFTLAVDRISEGADFISCVAFGKQAENIEKFVKKGNRLAVVGRIQTGSYEKDGTKVYTTDVIVENAEFIEPKRENEPEAKPAEKVEEPTPQLNEIDFDIPF